MRTLKAVVVAALALAGASAQAKDDELLADMASLDKVYIDPLFFTSNMHPPKAKQAMGAFVSQWRAFAARYRELRPSERGWSAHFAVVDGAIAAAQPIVDDAAARFAAKDPTCALLACPSLVAAHDALETVRYELRDLRIHNGFPKFVTDKLTAYHDPMEAIVLTFKGRPLAQVTPAELDAVGAWLDEALFLWSRFEATPIDAELWGFSDLQRAEIARRVAVERAVLERLAAAYDAGQLEALAADAPALKQAFVPVYTAFARDPLLNKLP
ncbi:MAG TPA: hypothetical protein VLT47_16030 [Anaeromyxobacteraceae bacterium]|nr:hypothetical protein [Anaeromyxobacteraceae bacterium]